MPNPIHIRLDPEESKVKEDLAFQTALDTRKFEIELYWKRATYFWAFIATAFAGFFTVTGSNAENKELISLCVNSMGIVASFTWCLVIKGSKYWQENWEKHVDIREVSQQGSLFSKVHKIKKIDRGLIQAFPYSVSKLNIIFSVYVFLIWCILFIYPSNIQLICEISDSASITKAYEIAISKKENVFQLVIVLFTIVSVASIKHFGKSSFYNGVVLKGNDVDGDNFHSLRGE
jgi:hypothetical protein